MTTQHTTTPWAVGWYRDVSATPEVPPSLAIWPATQRDGAVGDAVCLVAPTANCTPQDEANAAFIVRACNVHDELVAALNAIADADLATNFDDEYLQSLQACARAALAKVQE